jgi:AraC-like DNA-binding protein
MQEQSTNQDLEAKAKLRSPHPAIAPFVDRLLMGRVQMLSPADDPGYILKYLPIGVSILGYREYISSPEKGSAPASSRRKEFFLIGPQRGSFQETGIPVDVTSIVIKPGGIRALTGISALKVVDRTIPMESLWGEEAKLMMAKLSQEQNLDARMDILEQALIQRVAPHPEEDLFVVKAAQMIDEQKGKDSLGSFFTRTGYSRRQVLNRFNESLGFSPKHFARIIRLRSMFKSIDLKQKSDWAQLAREHGYSDQAHLVRDFRKLMGTTPDQFAREFQKRGIVLPGADKSVMAYRNDNP